MITIANDTEHYGGYSGTDHRTDAVAQLIFVSGFLLADKQALDTIYWALEDRWRIVRFSTAMSFSHDARLAPLFVPQLLKAISPTSDYFFDVAVALGEAGPSARGEKLDRLFRRHLEYVMTNEDNDDAETVSFHLGRVADAWLAIGFSDAEMLPFVVHFFAQADDGYYFRAQAALENISGLPRETVDAMVEVMRDSTKTIRERDLAAVVLEYQTNHNLTSTMIDIAATGDPWARARAATILGKQGDVTPQTMNALLDLVGDLESEVVANALEAIGFFADREKKFPHFQAAPQPSRQPLFWSFGTAVQKDSTRFGKLMRPRMELQRMDTGKSSPLAENAIPLLRQYLVATHGPSIVNQNAARALAKVGPEAFPHLENALQHPRNNVRLAAATAVAELRGEAKGFLPVLERRLRVEDDEMILSKLLDAMGESGSKAPCALQYIAQLSHDVRYSQYLRHDATQTLVRLGCPAEMLVRPQDML